MPSPREPASSNFDVLILNYRISLQFHDLDTISLSQRTGIIDSQQHIGYTAPVSDLCHMAGDLVGAGYKDKKPTGQPLNGRVAR
jgi:hypothetical protein